MSPLEFSYCDNDHSNFPTVHYHHLDLSNLLFRYQTVPIYFVIDTWTIMDTDLDKYIYNYIPLLDIFAHYEE